MHLWNPYGGGVVAGKTSIFGALTAVADPLRGRILLVLERHELAVSELCAVFQLPQSTMSRHLKGLADEGWLVSRAEGASRRYSRASGSLAGPLGEVWRILRNEVVSLASAAVDRTRVEVVLESRRKQSRAFFSGAAAEWDRWRRELIGARSDVLALLGLLDDTMAVGDLGCGTGQVSECLAPFVGRIVAVDGSAEMLAAARRRLEKFANVELRTGELERLPIEDGALDAAVIFLALPYVAEPEVVLHEAARVLRAGGRILVVDLAAHDREEYRQRLGHQALGFSGEQLQRWLEAVGFGRFRHLLLPPEPESRGPQIFIASGRKPESAQS
jgi:SAM-dependent methyltransferase